MVNKKVYFQEQKIKRKHDIYFADWSYNDPKKLEKEDLYKISQNLNKNYHWNKKKNIVQDGIYLNKISNKILNQMVLRLNKYHKTNYNLLYWKIIIYPWLVCIIDAIFDKWQMVKKIEKKNYEAIIYTYENKDFIVKNYKNLLLNNKEFTLWIISKIIKFKKKIKYKEKFKLNSNYLNDKKNFLNEGLIQKFIKKIIYLFNYTRFKQQKLLFYKTGLNFFEILILYYKLKIFPLFLKIDNYISREVNIKKRKKFFLNKNTKKDFESFLISNIYLFIPKSYLEDFFEIKKMLLNKNGDRKFKHIFTGTGFKTDDEFKIWVAEQVNMGSKYNIFQHGGTIPFNEPERDLYLAKAVAHKFLSSGWNDNNSKKIIPYSSIFLKQKFIRKKIKKFDVSIIYHMQSRITSKLTGMIKTNFNRLKIIYNFKKLSENLIKKKYKVSFRHQKEMSIMHQSKVNENYFNKEIFIDDAVKDIKKTYNNSKLILSEQFSTTFFECISYNLPIIILAEKNFHILSKKYNKIFNQMKNNKMIFTDVKKLEIFLDKNLKHIENWWNSNKIENVKKKLRKIIKKNKNIEINFLKKIITS